MSTNFTVPTEANAIPEFLTFIEPATRFKELGDLAVQAAETSDEFRQNVASIASWWGKAVSHDRPEQLVAILYLRAQEDLRSTKISSAKDLVKRTRQARAMLGSVDQTAVKSMVAEMEARIAKSKTLSRKLELAQQELAEMMPELEDVANRLVPQLPQPGFAKEMDGNVTELAWGCYLNGVRISCWLAVALVLAAIILL